MIEKPATGRVGGIYWYILQTRAAAKIAFKRYWMMTKGTGLLRRKPNESELMCTLFNDSEVHFKSGGNPEDLRAETLDGSVIDEVRQQPAQLWPMIIRPMLARRSGWCDFKSTPNGFDHFYDIYQFAKENPLEWDTFHAPSWEAPWWSPAEVESAKGVMSETEFAQEIGAEFRNLRMGQAYGAYNAILNDRLDSPFNVGHKVSPFLPIWVFCDFNVAPMHWILAQEFRGHIHAFKEIYTERLTDDPFEQHKQMLAYLKSLPFEWRKNGLRIVGDATGKATQRTSTKSDYDLIQMFFAENGIPFANETGEVNPSVKERVNTVNARLKAASGKVSVTLDPYHCPKLKKDLERVTWKLFGDKLDPGADNMLTHGSDALGYGVCHLLPIKDIAGAGILHVIRRAS